jgi:hypothetical protein
LTLERRQGEAGHLGEDRLAHLAKQALLIGEKPKDGSQTHARSGCHDLGAGIKVSLAHTVEQGGHDPPAAFGGPQTATVNPKVFGPSGRRDECRE